MSAPEAPSLALRAAMANLIEAQKALEAIRDYGLWRDGETTAKKLGELVDELVELAKKGLRASNGAKPVPEAPKEERGPYPLCTTPGTECHAQNGKYCMNMMQCRPLGQPEAAHPAPAPNIDGIEVKDGYEREIAGNATVLSQVPAPSEEATVKESFTVDHAFAILESALGYLIREVNDPAFRALAALRARFAEAEKRAASFEDAFRSTSVERGRWAEESKNQRVRAEAAETKLGLAEISLAHKSTLLESCETALNETQTKLAASEEKGRRMREFIERVEEWSRAYPVTIFHAPTAEQVRAVCDSLGITMVCLSASILREFTKPWGDAARAALAQGKPKDGEVVG